MNILRDKKREKGIAERGRRRHRTRVTNLSSIRVRISGSKCQRRSEKRTK